MKAGGSGRRAMRVLLVTLVALVVAFGLLIRFAYGAAEPGRRMSLDRVYALADKGQIVEATLLDEDARVVGTVCPAPRQGGGQAGSCAAKVERFHTAYPRSDVSTQALIERVGASARVDVDPQTSKAVAKLIVSFVCPLLLLANLFGLIFVSRGAESSIADIIGFGRIGRRQRRRRSEVGITFADVAGADEAVAELREVTEYLADPARFQAYGASAPKGVLLFGPPGCGKTLLARAVAGTSGVPFLSISGAEFVESLVGVGAARVRDLFRQVRAVAPAIVFIDEIDAVGRRREGEGMSGGEREQTLNQLLVEMDGFEVSAGIVVMAATNRPDILDPALMRPGRFDRHVTLEAPDVHGREAILGLHAAGKPLAADADLESLARATPGFTGADLANVINEAALLSIREGKDREGKEAQIGNSHLGEAVQRVLHGPQRRGRLMTAEERKRIAYHESGHALVAAALGQAAQVQRVSVVARGRGLGQSLLGGEDRVLRTRSELESELAMALAGIAAEELVFGESSTTAEADIERATGLAQEMVGRHGMSAELGRLRLVSGHNGYLGGEVRLASLSGHTLQAFDAETSRLVGAAEQRATDLLSAHREHLDAMAERLEADETLEGAALAAALARVRPEATLFAGAARAPARSSRRPKAGS